MRRWTLGILLAVALPACWPGIGRAAENRITIYYNKEEGEVNRLIFGNNFVAYDPSTYEDWGADFTGYRECGAGVWSPAIGRTVPEVIQLARDAGMSSIRFPGGCGAHKYNWKKAIGPERKKYLFGVDEFLKACREIGAAPVVTVSYFTGTQEDAADLVAYLNGPCPDTSGSGRQIWAQKRAANGHPVPYAVKYFEIGNEVWHGDHRMVNAVSPEKYARRYLQYYRAMKAVDPGINIGVILCDMKWNRKVLEIVQGNVDFGIFHLYPSPELAMNDVAHADPRDIFAATFTNMADFNEPYLRDLGILLRQKAGKTVPLVISEYNVGLTQDKPVPYRHSLGAALVNAEFINILLKPEHNVLMAHYWQYSNSYWGMVYAEGDYTTAPPESPPRYHKRPNYYPFELYHRHFGEVLLKTSVVCEAMPRSKNDLFRNGLIKIRKLFYEYPGEKIPPLQPVSVPYVSVNASKSRDGNTVYLAVINKHMESKIEAEVVVADFEAQTNARAWILSGPSVDATNEDRQEKVSVREQELPLGEKPFNVTFEPHSLTFIELERR